MDTKVCPYCKNTGIQSILVNGQPERDVCDMCDNFDKIMKGTENE